MAAFLGRTPVLIASLASWLVAVNPILCVGGLFRHACECESVVLECRCCDEAAPASVDDGCLDDCSGRCSHDGCENDPCQDRAATSGVSRSDLAERLASLGEELCRVLPASSLIVPVLAAPPADTVGHSSLGPPGDVRRIPCHPSELPLLL